jgi:hypothetical protein
MKNAALRREIPKPQQKGRKPKLSPAATKDDERIALFARKFNVMNELFVPNAAFLVDEPDFDSMDPNRYKSPATILQGVTIELFEEVPEDLHPNMREHGHFRDTVSIILFLITVKFSSHL